MAVDAGADALGLNFYEKSSRYLATGQAKEIVTAIASRVQSVGVFVNCDQEEIERIRVEVGLQGVQLHGDEPPDFISRIPSRPVIRARRVDDRGAAAVAEDLAACEASGRLPEALLVDAISAGQYGGTGETVSWAGLVDHTKWLRGVPLILAGGLTPENVAEAIRTVRPYGVDVASGVESSPGVKDPEKVRLFVAAAKAAFDEIVS